MANILGQDFFIFSTSGAASGTTGYTVIAASTSCKFTVSSELQDVTNKDSGTWVVKTPKRFSWTGSSDHMFETGNITNGYDYLLSKMTNKEKINLGFNIKDGSTSKMAAGAYVGSAYIISIDLNASDNDVVTFSVSFDGTGALVKLA